jgi:hypothetical protein
MRLEPQDEIELKTELAVLRFACNWTWPIMLLAMSIWDAMSIYGGALERDDLWWRLPIAVAWYTLAIHFWRADVKRLRAARERWNEAQR